jgi:hypothetical protein
MKPIEKLTRLKPGDEVNVVNGSATAMRVKVVTACGTETVCDLHPGAEVHLKVGTASADIIIVGTDENYTGLRLVPRS